MLYLGVDSGGTKAAFLLADETGKVYARYRGAGCAVLGARKEGVQARMEEGLHEICTAARIRKEDIAVMALGISGYGEGEGTEQETLEACEEAFLPGRCVCNLDTYVGWAGSLLFEPGVNVIAGTGSVVYGVSADGRTARASGWGAGCDEGSCSWHGQQLVAAYTKEADGRMPKTALYELFREEFGITGEDEHCVMQLNRQIVRGGQGLAALQYLLHKAYMQGDETAEQIYEAGAKELALGVKAVARRLKLPDGYSVSYSGGLFKAGECALKPFHKEIEALGAKVVTPRYEPDVGAVLMAIRFANPEYDVRRFCLTE